MIGDWIKDEVRSLVNEYGTRDPFELCDALGVRVICYPLPGRVAGFSLRYGEEAQIFLNERLEEELEATCAHELGHLRLHPRHNSYFLRECTCCVPGRYEREADLFAALLLLPEEAWPPAAAGSGMWRPGGRHYLPPRLAELLSREAGT